MKRKIAFDRSVDQSGGFQGDLADKRSGDTCGSANHLNIPQMRTMLQLMQASVADDLELCEFSAQLRDALVCLDELQALARDVMVEIEAERSIGGVRQIAGAMKLC